MTTEHSPTAPRAAPSKTQWTVSSFAPPLTTYAQRNGPLASRDARRFDRQALEARLADADEQAAIARERAASLVDKAAREQSVELSMEVRTFICNKIARANAFVHALQLLRTAIPDAVLTVKRRTGDSDEPVWVTARGRFESATAMLDQAEQLSREFRARRGRDWDHSVSIDLRRER